MDAAKRTWYVPLCFPPVRCSPKVTPSPPLARQDSLEGELSCDDILPTDVSFRNENLDFSETNRVPFFNVSERRLASRLGSCRVPPSALS